MSKVLLLSTGAEFPVTSEDGKYYYCGATQFRKANPLIVEVKEEIDEIIQPEEIEEMVEQVEEEQPKKKSRKKAEKKGE